MAGVANLPSGLSSQQSRLTVVLAKTHINQFVGGQLPASIDTLALINEVGQFFASMHAWKWLTDREISLSLRGSVALTGGTMSSDGFTLAKSSGFTDYIFVEGDVLEITSGTRTELGFYRIAAKQDASNIVLEDDPSVVGGAKAADIAGTIHTSSIPLPQDFRELIAIHPSSGTQNPVHLTSYQELLEKKAANMSSHGGYWAAITHAMDYATAGLPSGVTVSGSTVQGSRSGPQPRLEIVPQPSSNDIAAYKMYYRAGWTMVSGDGEYLRMPSYCETLYIEILRAFVASRYGDGDLNSMLTGIVDGPLLKIAVERDGSIQPDVGPIRNGASETAAYNNGFWNYGSINAPS